MCDQHGQRGAHQHPLMAGVSVLARARWTGRGSGAPHGGAPL